MHHIRDDHKHYIVNEPGDGSIIVSDDSGTHTHLEDDICLVYGNNENDRDEAAWYAERIAKLLNIARGMDNDDLTGKTLV